MAGYQLETGADQGSPDRHEHLALVSRTFTTKKLLEKINGCRLKQILASVSIIWTQRDFKHIIKAKSLHFQYTDKPCTSTKTAWLSQHCSVELAAREVKNHYPREEKPRNSSKDRQMKADAQGSTMLGDDDLASPELCGSSTIEVYGSSRSSFASRAAAPQLNAEVSHLNTASSQELGGESTRSICWMWNNITIATCDMTCFVNFLVMSDLIVETCKLDATSSHAVD